MRVLITGSNGRIGAALARALASAHEVRTLDLERAPTGRSPDVVGDPRERDLAKQAVADCDAVVHLAGLARPTAPPEDVLDAATRGTYNLLTTGNRLSRFILLSSLRPFERYPADYRVNESWAPRPTTDLADLTPYLAELTLREAARVLPIKAIALRLGEIVDEPNASHRLADPRWLHLDDLIQAVERALAFEPAPDGPQVGWWPFHISAGGPQARFELGLAGQPPFSYSPQHTVSAASTVRLATPAVQPTVKLGDRPGGAARRVVLFGAGGPLAAVTTEALAHDHVLRLTDARPLADIVAANKPQSAGSPLPRVLEPPHETRVVDVTDPGAVHDACRDMDAIVNCTVVRPHPVEAFRVNTIGAYNVMRAAAALGIRRVVHTGPQQVTLRYPAGYWYDFDLADDVPSRPGANLYILTKFLGQEICRIFAEEHELEVPTLLFSSFVNPATPAPEPLGAFPFSVSWEDAAQAMRLALRAPSFPRPFEVFHILADLPHGKYSNDKAKRLLKWQPRDRLEAHWLRRR
jgi:nucleoside-diphosphate-sugar epimerase